MTLTEASTLQRAADSLADVESERPGQSARITQAQPAKPLLHVEAELHHIAIDGVVVLAFDADLADVFGLGP